MRIKFWTGLALSAMLVLSGASGAQAALDGTPAYSVTIAPSIGAGNYSLGFEFKPTTNMYVTALGYWDQNHDGLYSDHQVAIYKVSDQSQVAFTTVLPADSGGPATSGGGLDRGSDPNGWYAYHALSLNVLLEANVLYRIAGDTLGHLYSDFSTLSSADGWSYVPLGSQMNLAPMTTTQAAYVNAADASVSYPSSNDAGSMFSTPNFLFIIPEPSSMILVGLGVAGVMMVRRRSK